MNDFQHEQFFVYIEDRFEMWALDVFLYERGGRGEVVLHQPGGKRYRSLENQAIPEEERIPIFRLPKDASHALLGALSRQLGAVEHPEQLRKDYEAERARVDRFIGHLTKDSVAK